MMKKQAQQLNSARSFSGIASDRTAGENPAVVELAEKIIPLERLASWRAGQRRAGRSLVVTNGCFDLLHAGHVTYLEAAKRQGDILLVGLNGDASVHHLKGPGRPLNRQEDRALVLAGLRSVDAVCIFPEPQADRFLAEAQPDVYVKGGDYTLDRLNPEERKQIESAGGRIVIIPFLPGHSTSRLVEKISGEQKPG